MERGGVIYLDNAATSWPKPPEVAEAMHEYLEQVGGSPGRSGHRMAIAAAHLLAEARESLAELLGADDPARIVFTKNATEALNLALLSLAPGDHVVTTSVEHNSVLRPLRALESRGVSVTLVPCSPDGLPDLDALESALRRRTALVVATHASNVLGALVPVERIARLAHEAGAPILVDAAQTAGAVPIDVAALDVDLLAFTGHKSLLGPPGTGGLWVREGIELRPLTRGGTGSASELELQPDFLPDALESGTQNIVGIAGLAAAVRFLSEIGVDAVQRHEQALAARFLAGAACIRGVTVYGPRAAERRIGLASFNLAGASPSDLGLILDRRFAIMARIGLHCAPRAHRTIGTYPDGAVRFAWSYFTTAEEIDAALAAVRATAERRAELEPSAVPA